MPQTKAFMARSAEIFEAPALFAPALACEGIGVNRDVSLEPRGAISGRHATHSIQEKRGLEGLFDDERAPIAERREAIAVRGVAGDEDEARGERSIARGRGAIELLAIPIGHPDIRHDQVIALAADALERLAAAGRHIHAPAG